MQLFIKQHIQYVGQSVLCLLDTVCVSMFLGFFLPEIGFSLMPGCYIVYSSHVYQGEAGVLKYRYTKTQVAIKKQINKPYYL